MAKSCFRCGEPIKGLTARGMNKKGERTVALVERCREVARDLPSHPGGDPDGRAALIAQLDEMADEGDDYAAFWHDFVHDVVVPPPPSEARRLNGEWAAWAKKADGMTNFLSLPRETARKIIERDR